MFDIALLEPGQSVRLFGNAHVGEPAKTNLVLGGQAGRGGGYEDDYKVRALGVRPLGYSADDEIPILDHIVAELEIGNHRQLSLTGPLLSMMRPQSWGIGYMLAAPLSIPYRQRFCVWLRALPELPRAVPLRVVIGGVLRSAE